MYKGQPYQLQWLQLYGVTGNVVMVSQVLHDCTCPGGMAGCNIGLAAAGAWDMAAAWAGTKVPSVGGALILCIKSAGNILSPRCRAIQAVSM